MSKENENEPLIFEMEDVDGVPAKVEIVGIFEDGGKMYAVADDVEDDESSYLFEVQHTEEGDVLLSVDDEEEFNRLCKVLEDLEE